MLQRSYQENNECGRLYLVATPIGNLEDITFRAIRILKEADLIAAEDTRQTKKLCSYYEIHTRLISYHEHNKKNSGPEIIRMLKEGRTIALVSDAGLPAISDPGADLVSDAAGEGIPVIPIPGANAALSALTASGLPTERFMFLGFLPRESKKKQEALLAVQAVKATLICYESPYRLIQTLQAIQQTLGNRTITLARELTKKFEEFLRTSTDEAIVYLQDAPPRGEYCIIIEEGEVLPAEAVWWHELGIKEHYDHYTAQGLARKEAMKKVAKDRNVSKRDIYQSLLHN